MSRTCCICGSAQVEQGENVIFFDFPISAYLRRKWKDAIQISGRITYDMVVCNRHFEKEQYKTVKGRPRLIGRVVPSLFLNKVNNTSKDNLTKENAKNEPDVDKCSNSDKGIENVTNKPATEKPLTEKPLTDKPLTEKPLTDKPLTDKPLTDEPLTETPLTEKPSILESLLETERTEMKKENIILNTENNAISDTSREKIENSETDSIPSEVSINIDASKEVVEVLDVPAKEFGSSSKDLLNDTALERNIPYFSKQSNFHSANGVNEICRSVSPTADVNDIEDILTNYHIQNKGQLAMESHSLEQKEPEIKTSKENDPVFIEISVGRDPHSSAPSEVPGSQDCLMVLESVQVDVDPSTFLLPEQEYDIANDDDDDDDEVQITEDKKPDPISLLTSSDESDVILEEPKIDTVEVSDETDEDDVPLVKLVPKSDQKSDPIAKMMCSLYDFHCLQCKFYAMSKAEYIRHIKEHQKVLQICQVCGYTTASKMQYERHRRKHKEDRRFKCHLCDYKARHNMSLIYHLKTHEAQGGRQRRNGYCCQCGFHTNERAAMLKHVQSCRDDGPKKRSPKKPAARKVYSCNRCSYATVRKGDLKRHEERKHATIDDEDDEDYVP